MKGYKFIQKDMKSKNGTDTKWRLNIWKKHKGDISLCEKGYHASAKPIDILEYIYGPRLFVVETRGKIIKGDNKFVAEEMRLIKELPTKKIFVEFAIRCAERCLNNFEKWNKEDKRPREAIIAAKNYLNNPCKKTQVAARSAARSAAESAAWSAAWSAAESARSAAWSAAWSAAESAAESARSAARSAAWSAAESAAESAWSAAEKKWQERILNKIFKRYERND